MYRQVPPPEYNQEEAVSTTVSNNDDTSTKPGSVSSDQWKRFQKLKARRLRECGQSEGKRKRTAVKKVLQTVEKELTESDKELLAADGVILPKTSRKRKRTDSQPSRGGTSHQSDCSNAGKNWSELRPFLDPNPQLRGVDKGRYADKTGLEEEMEELIERRQYEAAATVSDTLARRQLATKIATAFDCLEYSKEKEVEEKRKKAKKKSSSSLSFPVKQRWECKSNM